MLHDGISVALFLKIRQYESLIVYLYCVQRITQPPLVLTSVDLFHHWPSVSRVAAIFHAVSFNPVHCCCAGLLVQSPILSRSVQDPSIQKAVRNDFQTLRCCLPGRRCLGHASVVIMHASGRHSSTCLVM